MAKEIYIDEMPAYRLRRYGEIIGTYDKAKNLLRDWQLGDVVYDAEDKLLTTRQEIEALAVEED